MAGVHQVATLREGLKDQLEQISRLEVQKNEQAIELNFKIARKVCEQAELMPLAWWRRPVPPSW